MVFTRTTVFVLLFIIGQFGASRATVHRVGDSAGWTILGHIDYKKWASTKTFHSGDSLLFAYNSKFHNVKQVSHQDFMSCNAESPVATYTSGSDTVTLKRPGNYYFLCGVPGHCQAGQKVHVLVARSSDSTSRSPAMSPAASPSDSAVSSPEVSAQNGAVSFSPVAAALMSLVALVVFVVDFM